MNILWYLWLVVLECSRLILRPAIVFVCPKERKQLAFGWFFLIILLPRRAISGTLSLVIEAVVKATIVSSHVIKTQCRSIVAADNAPLTKGRSMHADISTNGARPISAYTVVLGSVESFG